MRRCANPDYPDCAVLLADLRRLLAGSLSIDCKGAAEASNLMLDTTELGNQETQKQRPFLMLASGRTRKMKVISCFLVIFATVALAFQSAGELRSDGGTGE